MNTMTVPSRSFRLSARGAAKFAKNPAGIQATAIKTANTCGVSVDVIAPDGSVLFTAQVSK
jgi:hypothetical protein